MLLTYRVQNFQIQFKEGWGALNPPATLLHDVRQAVDSSARAYHLTRSRQLLLELTGGQRRRKGHQPNLQVCRTLNLQFKRGRIAVTVPQKPGNVGTPQTGKEPCRSVMALTGSPIVYKFYPKGRPLLWWTQILSFQWLNCLSWIWI